MATNGTITGKIISVVVKGMGVNSATLEFVVQATGDRGVKHTMIVTAYPEFEPQLFSAMASFVIAAHHKEATIEATYLVIPCKTSRAIELKSVSSGSP